MKKINLIALLLLVAGGASAQTWTVDKNHSQVGFGVTHLMISEVDGSFKAYDATIVSSKDDLSDAIFEVSADITSISTNNDNRDNHLKSPDFFDAVKYPKFIFKSTAFKKVNGNKYKVSGDLTIKGVTKTVEFDAVVNGPVAHPRSKKLIAGVKVTGTVNRTDFGIGSPGGAMVSEDVTISASGEFEKQ